MGFNKSITKPIMGLVILSVGVMTVCMSVSAQGFLDSEFAERYIDWSLWVDELGNFSNNTVYFGNHLPSYYLNASGVNLTIDQVIDQVSPSFVNITGDVMSGDLNITEGQDFVNISQSGAINLTGNITGIAWSNLKMAWSLLREIPHHIANNYTERSMTANSSIYGNFSTWTANLLGNYTNNSIYLGGHLPAHFETAAGGGAITAINITPKNYTGEIHNGTLRGYKAAHGVCKGFFGDDYRMCNEFEITEYLGKYNPDHLFESWVITGAPKYIPADVPVNDCTGWTYNGTVTSLGNYWFFDAAKGGDGRALNCGTSFPLACCK